MTACLKCHRLAHEHTDPRIDHAFEPVSVPPASRGSECRICRAPRGMHHGERIDGHKYESARVGDYPLPSQRGKRAPIQQATDDYDPNESAQGIIDELEQRLRVVEVRVASLSALFEALHRTTPEILWADEEPTGG